MENVTYITYCCSNKSAQRGGTGSPAQKTKTNCILFPGAAAQRQTERGQTVVVVAALIFN